MKFMPPYYNISSFIGFRTEEERAEYENVLDFNKNWYQASYKEFSEYEGVILKFMIERYHNYFQWGFLCIDSSETLYTVLLIHLLRFKEKNPNFSGKPNFLVSKLRHLVLQKAAVVLGIELIEVDLKENGDMNTEDLQKKINENTFCVVGVAGTTEMGNSDDIVQIDRICSEKGVPLHIDAAVGGFIFPFVQNVKMPSDISQLKAALTINISGHKYGYARPSIGILLLKSKDLIPQSYFPVRTSYLAGGPSDEYGLMGSKPAIGLIDLHYNVTKWGAEGFQKIVDDMFIQKKKLIASLQGIDERLHFYDSGDTPIFLLYGEKEYIEGLSQGLLEKGWQTSSHYNFFLDKHMIRVLIRKHFTDDYNASLVHEIKTISASV